MKLINIYGAGGLGREILSMIRMMDDWKVTAFFDDGIKKDTVIDGMKVAGGLNDLLKAKDDTNVVIAIGDPQTKRLLSEKLNQADKLKFPVLIHPSAIIQDRGNVKIGEGSIITTGCILTTGIKVGAHVLLNLNTTVGHDARIGSCSSIMPGVNIAGGVVIGDAVLVGAGANILNGLTLGSHCRVGAGAVVTREVPGGDLVVGIPARVKVREIILPAVEEDTREP